MLTQAQMDEALQRVQARMQDVTDRYFRVMGKHLREIGRLAPSDVHRLQQIRRMDRNLAEVKRQLARAAGMNLRELERALKASAQVDDRVTRKILGVTDEQVKLENNLALQRALRAQYAETAGRLVNLSNSTVSSGAYREAVDAAVTAVQSGAEDYESAIRRHLRQAGEMGLQVRETGTRAVEYASGHTRRVDTAVRMNVLDALRRMNQRALMEAGQQFGADGVEIDAHMLCAEDHLPYQGGQYSNAEFEEIQDSLQRPFGEWNCRHTWHPILLGISPRTYTDEDLARMERYSTEPVEIDGVTRTRYEWSQAMRRMETAIRRKKDTATLAKAAGDEPLRRRCQGSIQAMLERYECLSDQAGLGPDFRRTYVAGFVDGRTDAAMSKPKADIGSWPEPGTRITAAELSELQKYASDRHVDLRSFDNFDGDVSLVKDFIDGIVTVSKDYPEVLEGKRPLQLRCSYRIEPDTYAETTNRCISINGNAFRNREALDADYKAQEKDNFFVKGTTYHSIAHHEMGHVLIDTYGLSPKQIVGKLKFADVSTYAGYNVDEAVAESVSAHYAGVDNKTALTIYSRCATMIAERRRR